MLRILSQELLPDSGAVHWLPSVQIGFLQQHIKMRQGITIKQYLQSTYKNLYETEQEMHTIAEKMAAMDNSPELLLGKYGKLQGIINVPLQE
ncbi:hypothetical protein [Fictibacillus sp. KU28468]|uniref:hypothetical protein n=1 Tax=Fictibacillus sp. KU28468 TaxID=2991053 RepID=UPI00223D8B3D|nr:hypothetical protein [Fictibacillus sp. KU28468]UZJ77885.1 hypothetical protein OKX00_17225 [Fictibacillus sp. KU28468]